MKALRKHSYALFVALLLYLVAAAQTGYHINTAETMNTVMLTALIKDRSDNMWIGTMNGLYKHEGSRIRAFNRIGKGPNELSGGEMHTLLQDKRGFIWVGTTNGLDKIDPVTYTIKHYPLRSADTNSSFVGYIYSVFQDNEEYIWASTDAAMFRMNYQTGEYKVVPVTKDKTGLPSEHASYKSGISTPTGLWIHTHRGLAFYEYATGNFYHRWHNPKNKDIFRLDELGKGAASDLRIDKKNNLWFVSNDRNLVRYNLTTEKLDSFAFHIPAEIWRCCYSLAVDSKGNVWLGFRQGGVHVLNQQTGKFTVLTTASAYNLLKSDYIYSLEEDYQGRMWMSTDNGLDIIDLYSTGTRASFLSDRSDFTNLKYQMGTPTTDGKEYVYVPFYQYGFLQVDLKKDTVKHFHLLPDGSGGTTYIIPKDAHSVWSGRDRKLMNFSLDEGKVLQTKEQPPIPALADSLGDIIWHYKNDSLLLYKTNRGRIFYQLPNGEVRKTRGYGFKKNLCISPDKKTFWYLDDELNLIKQSLVTHQSVFVPLQQKLKGVDFSFSNPRDIVDDGQSIFMCGQNGLLQYNYLSDKLTAHTATNGLAHSFTYSVCLDRYNNLYVGSLGGIDIFNRSSKVFENLVSFPVAAYTDAFGGSVMMNDGTLQFVMGNKLYRLNPDEIVRKPLQRIYKLQLQQVVVNGETIRWTSDGLKELSYDENRVLLRFGLLDFVQQSGVQYFYYLEGLDNTWIENLVPGEVSYNALAPASYVFHVQCRDAAGRILGQELTFPIQIHPPFWQRWWFTTLLVAGFVFAVYYMFMQRVKKIRRDATIRQQLTELESKALRAQMNPHFIFNSLNAIQELVVTKNDDAAYDYLSKFSKLLRLVLNNSEKSLIPLADEITMLQLYLELESLRFRQSFSYEINVAKLLDADSVLIPPLLLQPFLENAVWHGLMLKEGEKKLRLAIMQQNGNLFCTMEDNGIGRKKSAEIKAQKLGAAHFDSKGLSLSRQRINLIEVDGRKGSVEITDLYDNELPIGTKVIIQLPLIHS